VILLEIAAQGVRGVAPAGGRAVLRPGYNVLGADGAALRRLIEALFYPAPRDGESIPRTAAGPGASPARCGATLVGNDGVTYRLVRELGGPSQLHRFDPERRSFAPVSQDLVEIAALMRDAVGVPGRGRLSALLSVDARDLPSRQPVAGLRGPAAVAAPRRAVAPEEAKRRLDELRSELTRAHAAEKLQYQLDGLQSRFFKLEELLKSGGKIRDGIAAAEAARRELEPVERAVARLGDVDSRIAAFERADSRRQEALARLEGESALDEGARLAPAPFWKDPRFLLGVGAGILAAVVAIAGSAGGAPGFRYLALLDVPAFAWAGWVALEWVDGLEAAERAGRRRKRLEERERKEQEQHERDTGEVRALLKALSLESIGELKEALGRLADARSVSAEWHRRMEEWEAKPETKGALEEKAKVEAEIAGVEAKLSAEAGGYMRDPRSVEMDMARLEADLAAQPPAAADLPPAGLPADPLRALLEKAAAELSSTVAAALRVALPQATQLLPALSSQRLASFLVDERGNLMVQGGGKTQPASALSPADRDLCFLCIKLGLMEHGLAAGRTVALADDAFAGLPEASRRVVARLMKQLARSGQLIHATSDPIFREVADQAA
jgi:hypothetical protein